MANLRFKSLCVTPKTLLSHCDPVIIISGHRKIGIIFNTVYMFQAKYAILMFYKNYSVSKNAQ